MEISETGVEGPGSTGGKAPLIKGLSKDVLKDLGLWTTKEGEDEDDEENWTGDGDKNSGKEGAVVGAVGDASTS